MADDRPPSLDTPAGARANVRAFYDDFGWRQDAEGRYLDGATADDWRPAGVWYRRACNRRVGRVIAPRGGLLLDAASGAVQFDEYLEYSRGYAGRVCVDFSRAALGEARRRLGDKALVVQADVTALPFRADAFDGFVSLHTIYHVPASDQWSAFAELFRTLRPGRSGAIVYAQSRHVGHPLPRRLAEWLAARGRFRRRLEPEARPKNPPGIYYYPLPLAQVQDILREKAIPYAIGCWRSVSVSFGQLVVPGNVFGKLVFGLIHLVEEILPRWCGTRGSYPLIVVRKPADPSGPPPG